MKSLSFKWKPYLKYGKRLVIKKGTIIYLQGEKGHGFYYLHEGKLKVSVTSESGSERTINYVPEGMLFGENGAHKGTYVTTAKALTDVIAYYFSDRSLEQITSTYPEATTIFTDSLLYKFRLLGEMITFLDSSAEQQIAHYLLKLDNELGGVSINQTSFAQYIGTSRITVNKILNKWHKEGFIELTKDSIRVIHVNKLEEIRSYGIQNYNSIQQINYL